MFLSLSQTEPSCSKCAFVAQYHPLVGLCLVVGTLTSKQLSLLSFPLI